jgi:hypothetical protein
MESLDLLLALDAFQLLHDPQGGQHFGYVLLPSAARLTAFKTPKFRTVGLPGALGSCLSTSRNKNEPAKAIISE